ncbi:DUF7668 domain-containing protein [Actinomadura fibrosa]|uniref:DUF7668 domain-containing protein n=1 Tax=Actinomadura fibrosa TaxID=111802 RepID=A0ABW2XPR4_9ACTN|nr:hypothetical protein [Actinomadura fibrosa]
MLPEEGVNAVRAVLGLLVRGHYEELETLTEGRRLSAGEMASAIERTGRHLITPPDGAFRSLDAVPLADGAADERAFRVRVPLWTAQDGLSDLAVSLLVTEVMDGVWTVELLGIHAGEGT